MCKNVEINNFLFRAISKSYAKDNTAEQLNCFIKIRYHILSSIDDTEDLYPMYVINGIDHSLKTYIKEHKSSLEPYNKDDTHERDMSLHTEITRLLCQILNGLCYLHSHKLVHYDLTIDSIGVR